MENIGEDLQSEKIKSRTAIRCAKAAILLSSVKNATKNFTADVPNLQVYFRARAHTTTILVRILLGLLINGSVFRTISWKHKAFSQIICVENSELTHSILWVFVWIEIYYMFRSTRLSSSFKKRSMRTVYSWILSIGVWIWGEMYYIFTKTHEK